MRIVSDIIELYNLKLMKCHSNNGTALFQKCFICKEKEESISHLRIKYKLIYIALIKPILT